MNKIKKAAPRDFRWSHKTTNSVLIELEYRENLSNLKILKALTNLRSTVGNKKANRLGRIAIASIIAEKLKMYFNLTLVLLWVFVLFSTQDHNLPIYSIEKIVT